MNDQNHKKKRDIRRPGQLSTCPECGYTDGFHVSFEITEGYKNTVVILICPNCHARFGLNWQIDLA